MDVRRRLTPARGLFAAGAVLLACAAAPVLAAGAARGPAAPEYLPPTPPGWALGARRAVRVADRDPAATERAPRSGRLETSVAASDDGRGWRVAYSDAGREVALVIVDRSAPVVLESWTGDQVAWPMARGYEGQFGHALNAPYVWLPLCALFLIGLVEWRRPLRLAHLDLLALLAFGVSHLYFNRGEIGVSVPLAYPVLVYLLGRGLWLGFRGGRALRPSVPARWLAIAAVFLIAFRITLNVADSGVIDVGYAGAVGADLIAHGEPIYGEGVFPPDNPHGDTYGPVNYFAYLPFELALGWSGEWDALPAAHAAALAFDLATVAGLFAFGVRLRPGPRGRELGVLLAFAWLAYPYTTFALQSNSNDALVAALIAWSLALFTRPAARGALAAAAAAAKFAPLALAPLYAAGERALGADRAPGEPARPLLPFALAFVLVTALALVHPAIDPGLGSFWERTAGAQIGRDSPFSVWGQVDGIGALQSASLAAAGLLAAALAFVPRRRSIAQVAALAAAVVIAVQLTAEHWFYLYIPWFAPALLIALAIAGPAVNRAPARGPA